MKKKKPPAINFCLDLLKDNRFFDLSMKLGSKPLAIGELINAWIIGLEYWDNSRNGIPKPIWERNKLSNLIIEVGLAKDTGDFVLLSGSEEQFQWKLDSAARYSNLGKLGNAVRWSKERQNISKNANTEIIEENVSRTIPYDPVRSREIALSLSLSPFPLKEKKNTKKRTLPSATLREELLVLYATYPKKSEEDKEGIDRLVKSIKTEKAFESFKLALSNYLKSEHVVRAASPQFVKSFKSFAWSWKSWVAPATPSAPTSLPSVDFSIPVTVAEARHGKL